MKYILIIGDGMADNPVEQLGGRTPLQVANIPTIDFMAARGTVGHVVTCPKPYPAGSEIAILSIMGCDPRKYFNGRSPMEAAASGIQLQHGDVAYRCNIIGLEDSDAPYDELKIVSHSAGSIAGEDALEVVRILQEDPEFSAAMQAAGMVIYPHPVFRQIVVQANGDVDGLKLIPPHDHLGEAAGQHMPSGNDNAAVIDNLMRLAHKVLKDHPFNQARRAAGKIPANGIWLWAYGMATELPSFEGQYGHTGGVISGVALVHGIGALRGLEMIQVPGATGEIDTNFEGKMQATVDLLRTDADFCCLHLEAPDECTHNGDLPGKIQAIEWLDSRLIKPIFEQLDADGTDYRVLLISDHKTLTATRGHDGDPVPFLLYEKGKDTGFGGVFNEDTGMAGPEVPAGHDLLEYLFDTKSV